MKLLRALCIVFFIFPFIAHAQQDEQKMLASETFEARVIEIVSTHTISREDGSTAIQQDLRLQGLTGNFKDREMQTRGISELDVIDAGVYKNGDRVIVSRDTRADGTSLFTVIDYVRRPYLYLLAALFVISIIAIGRWKGLRAFIGLLITFIVIMAFMIPYILSGSNPILISFIGSIVIAIASTLITEGWNRKSHIAIGSISCTLLLALGISILFTKLTRLTGFSQEETLYLISLGKVAINFQGLLLAGILIGTLGVLDDAVLSQIEAVAQIRDANPLMSKTRIFKMASKIGNSHLGAIVNTLFLTYAGASLPLLLLFKLHENGPIPYGQVLNSEVIATEILRTLVGSIAIALALPIATLFAVYGSDHPKSARAAQA